MVVARAPPGRRAPPPPPALSSFLVRIQTDAGRRSDAGIRHNRIVAHPFPRKVGRSCRPLLAGSLLAAVVVSLLVAEQRGFLAVPFAATDRKHVGRAPHVGTNTSSADAAHDDEFGGADDDATVEAVEAGVPAQDAAGGRYDSEGPAEWRGTADDSAGPEDAAGSASGAEGPSGDGS